MTEHTEQPVINWAYPAPRKGLPGAWDRFIGPGSTPLETALILIASLLGGGMMLAYALLGAVEWDTLQIVLAVLMAFDITGGVVANMASPLKRYYHREGRTPWQHLGFVALHLVYLALAAFVFDRWNWLFFGITGGYLLVAAAGVLSLPLYLRRSMAALLTCGAIVLALALPIDGLAWLVPFLFIKLIMGNILREEPYRPA
nr:hypothetical protein [Anaerolineae bacterium]